MIVPKNIFILLCVVSLAVLHCVGEEESFEVLVVDPTDAPVAGAWIEGGIDWTRYRVYTDSNGVAVVPGHARGEHAIIMKDNFIPLFVERLDVRQYLIEPTQEQLRLIGETKGTAIIFDADNIVTLNYQGDYHVYTYDNQDVTEIASAILPATMKQFRLFGDTLWFTTHDDGIYVYSLTDILQPQLLFHLGITGYLGAFAVKDSIVVVCSRCYPGPLRVFSYSTSGQFQELASISEFIVDEMTIRGSYLIVVGGESSMPTVFDLTNPVQPILVYNGLEPGAETGLILDTILVVVPEYYFYTASVTVTYKLVRLTNPASPYFCGIFYADAWLYDIINNEYALGGYSGFYATAVLTGDIADGFTTVALITEAGEFDYGGSHPPYFLIHDQLWILEPR